MGESRVHVVFDVILTLEVPELQETTFFNRSVKDIFVLNEH